MTVGVDVRQTTGQTVNKRNWAGLGLLVLYFLLYLIPLGNRPLGIPDETRYAEIPREMLASGDWVSPRLNGLRYFEKPPLGYWLNASAISVLGENPFAVRLSSALATGLTTLFTFLFALKVLADRRVALLAAFIHMTFLEVYFVGTYSVLDNLLALFLSSGIMAYFLAVKEQNRTLEWVYWSISGLSLGLAFLTKGFLALAVPVIVLAPWSLWHGYWRELLVKGWFVLFIALLVALPWSILIHLRESDFWHYFFWVEHIMRFTAQNAQHKAPFYYFLVLLPALAFPWFSLMPAAFAGLRIYFQDKEASQFLWAWLLLPFLFFSFSSGKLATYLLPCFPPLAMLIAAGLSRVLEVKKNRLFQAGMIFNMMILAGLLLALLISWFFDVGFSIYQPAEMPQFIMTAAASIAALGGSFWALKSSRPEVKSGMTLLVILPFIVLLQVATPELLKESKAPGEFITKTRNLITDDTLVIADGAVIRAVNWYLKRNDVYLINAGEMSYGLNYPDAAGRLLDAAGLTALLANRQGRPLAIYCRKACPDAIKAVFPENSHRHSYGKFSMWLIP